MYIKGRRFNVLELIKYISHVEGGIHNRKLEEELNSSLFIQGISAGLKLVKAIPNVVFGGLCPLKMKIEDSMIYVQNKV